MYVCILNQDGAILRHRTRQTSPETLLRHIAPDRAAIVVAVECLFTWDWLAALGAQDGIPVVRGPALSMQASHGGKAQPDTIDAHTIAVLLRGGRRPQASVYPAVMRAPRHLLRRRLHLMRKRAARLTHLQQTKRQDHLPEMGQKIVYTAHRAGVAERFADPAGHQSIAVDLALLSRYDALLHAMEWSVLTTANAPHTTTLYGLRTVPGIGEILRLVLLDEIPAIHRCPRGQDVVSDCRLVQCAKEAAGQRSGTGGSKIGQASLQWACSEAAVLFLRDHPSGQKYLARVENTHGKGKALTVLAHPLARAVYDMLKRATACNMDKCSPGSGEGSGCA